MAITLRSEKGSPLLNNEVDGNFIELRDEKISRDGTIAMTGKLVAVQPSTTRANIRLPKNDSQEPSSPTEGDLWNYGGVLKFRKDGSTTTQLVTTDDSGTVTNTMLAGSIANNKLANSSITVTAGTGVTVTGSPVSLGGSVTVTNAGVTGITGTSNQVVASASTGSVTLSLPQSIATTSNVQFGGVGVGTAGASGEVRATGEITAYYTSDITLKENIVPIADALAKVSQLRGVMFDWTDAHIESRGGEDDFFVRKHDVGVIAQEVQAVLPEVVATRENGTLAVRYEKLVPLLIQAINELNEKISKCNCAK